MEGPGRIRSGPSGRYQGDGRALLTCVTQTPHLVLIVAAAGYGKSAALDSARPRGGKLRSARAALDDGLPAADWIGIDDLHELTRAEQLRLTHAVSTLPPATRVVLTSRLALDPEVRVNLRGRVRERGPEDLALSAYAVHRVLVDEYGVLDPEVPLDVHVLTAGWPALVHFAGDALSRNPAVDLRTALGADSAPAAYWLREEVLPDVSPAGLRSLVSLSGLGPVTPATGDRAELVGTGLLTLLHAVGQEGLVQVVPAVAESLAAAGQRPTQTELRAVAEALERDGLPFGAARAHARLGDWTSALRLVADRGDEMLRRGEAAGVRELVETAPAEAWSDGVRATYADSLWLTGDLPGATRALAPLVAEAEAGRWTQALASRMAAVHYSSGRFEQALDVLARPGTGAPDARSVDCIGARAHVLCSLGRTDEAVGVAVEALELAESTGDPTALTSAHLAMARVSSGERKEAHHEQALHSAASAGDVVVAARILVNQSFQLLATARFEEAAWTARAALLASDVGVATGRRAAALHNLAEALMYLGEYDEAAWHLNRAVALCRRLGIGRTALGLLGLAEIDRQLGRDDRAHARYVEAVELARGSGEAQVLVPGLAGLARVHAFGYDDPEGGLDRGRAAAEEATALATGGLRPFALTAAGWVALRGGDRPKAVELARASVAAAREIAALDLLAEALELAAACSDPPEEARRLLTEALAIWRAGGARPPALRIELQLGRLPGADATARSRARDAARELQRLGVRHVNGQPVSAAGTAVPVQVEVLGGFRVSVEDEEVPVTAWRSRQARTLVKILAGRRGRPVTRAWLCETLWPDDDPAKTGHRLSVLLATVRGVLDPAKRWPTDRFVAADLTGVWLDLRHVALDAETLVRDAEVAAILMDEGEVERAAEILADINARYRGDAFEDEPGEEWADGVREEVRAAWQRSVRRLAAIARRSGRVGDAQTLLVRLLVADPYDEKIHALLVKSLVGAGRRGEARRAFERWRSAMREIGAPPPDPAFLGARPVVTPY